MEISHTIYVITALYHFSCVTACTCIFQLDHQVTFSRTQNMQKRLYLHYSYVFINKPTRTMHI